MCVPIWVEMEVRYLYILLLSVVVVGEIHLASSYTYVLTVEVQWHSGMKSASLKYVDCVKK
jgi:hypothetical protein